MRNPNGLGSVTKLSGKRRKPWVARVTVGQEPYIKKNGAGGMQQIRITIGCFETKKEALEALFYQKKDQISPKANITLSELYSEWEAVKFHTISPSTQQSYAAAWKVLKTLGGTKVKDLRTAHIQKLINESKNGRSSLAKIKILSHLLFDYALENDIVSRNYAEFLKLPKESKVEKKIFSDTDIAKLKKHDKEEWADTILILIYTGLRIAELLTLPKLSVHLKEGYIVAGIKTDAGIDRAIPIHPCIQKYIAKWYKKKGDYLICREDGSKMPIKWYRENAYYPTLESMGISKELNPHCCRHTCASILAKRGVDIIMIQKIMGHKKYSFTADVYTHTDIDQLKDAIKTM